jgi:hypothetical protein
MALFEPSPAELAAAQPMIEWLNAAPAAEVAAEVMAAFGPGGPGAGGDGLTRDKLVEWLFRDYPKPGAPGGGIFTVNTAASYPVGKPVLEALQLLEHAELVMYEHWFDQNYPQLAWLATRLGTSTLAEGKAAIRQRIAQRTGL